MSIILMILALIPESNIARSVAPPDSGHTITMQDGTTVQLLYASGGLSYRDMECIGASYEDGMIVLEWTASVYGIGMPYGPRTMYWREFYAAEGDELVLHHTEMGTLVPESIRWEER